MRTKRQHREARTLPHDVRNRGGRRDRFETRHARQCVAEREEPVAALVHRLDEPRHIGLVAQRDAQPPHGGVQAVLEVDEGAVRPEPAAQLLAPTTSPGRSSSADQNPQRLLLQRDAEAALAQLAVAQVQLEGAEPDDVRQPRVGYCLHPLPIEWIVS